MHLSILFTCLLLVTGGDARSLETDDVEIEPAEEEGIVMRYGGAVVVENGTVDAVVLDCPFELKEEDLNSLTIKWYYQPTVNANPVYQWIPDTKPYAFSGFLKDRLDLTYEASSDAHHRYRALRILSPTTDVTGHYECRVGTFGTDIHHSLDLVVFREPSDLYVWVERLQDEQVKVSCRVEEVFPQPVLELRQKSSSKDSEVLRGGKEIPSNSRGTYSMVVEKVVQEATLDGLTEFECHTIIPNTELRFTTSTKYQPRVTVTTGAVKDGSSIQQASAVLLFVVSLLVCLLND